MAFHALFRRFFVLCSLIISASTLSAQVVIWSEDFSGYPNATLNSPGLWSATGTDCDDPALNVGNQYGVYNGAFTVQEVEGAPCCMPAGGGNNNEFTTVPIDISAYCSVDITLLTGSSGDLECESPAAPVFNCTGNNQTDDFHDQMVIEYDLDGNTIQGVYICGDNGVGPISITGIQGNSLVLRILAANKFGTETYTFDDIEIVGFPPEEPNVSIPQTTFCETEDPITLNPNQGGVVGSWSGPGVVGNTFDPTLAGDGPATLTFTPAPSECALPATVNVNVTPAPSANTATDETCLNGAGVAIFNLTTLDNVVNGGSGNPVSWYFNSTATFPIGNPAGYSTAASTTVYAVVTVGGCSSFPVPVSLIVNTCAITEPTLGCDPATTQSVCTICWNGIANEIVPVYINFPDLPPGGYDFTITYGNGTSGFQTADFTNYMGGPINFPISETTIFFISEVICDNNCIDQIDLGNQVTYVLELQPQIDNPGDQSDCSSYTLPAITGQNLPADVAYFTAPNGNGTTFMPGDVITTTTTLYIYANTGECSDEVSFTVTIEAGFDPSWSAPSGLCANDGTILLTPDNDLSGTWTGTGITDNGDGTAIFDPSAMGAGQVTYSGGTPPCDAMLTQIIDINIPSDTTFTNATTCDPMMVGQDTTLLQNQFGCDSVVITNTSLLPADTIFVVDITCDPMMAGVDTLFLQNSLGCDSLVITTTDLEFNDTLLILNNSCNPLDTGVMINIIPGPVCDSVIITDTKLLPSDTTFLTDFSCDPMQVGLDTVFLQNQDGCDSLIITNTLQATNDTLFLFNSSCNPLDTGTVIDIFTGPLCDTVVITSVGLLPSDTTFLQATTCEPMGAGLDTLFLQNELGCDSLVITDTELVFNDTTLVNQSSCNPLDTGVVINVVPGAICDTVVITTTSLLPGDTTFLTDVTCDPMMAGPDTVFLQNSLGCDSLVITDFILEFNDTLLVLDASCNPLDTGLSVNIIPGPVCDSVIITDTKLLPSDTTFLVDFTCDPLEEGSDTLFLQNQQGCDSLIITNTLLDFNDTLFLFNTSCNPLDTGTIVDILSGPVCDTVLITTVGLLPSDTTNLTAGTCDPMQVGIDTVFLQNEVGCDSLVITTTSLLPSDETQLTASTCDPQQVGMDTVFLNNQFGCDSLVITTTSLLPSDETQLTANTCDPQQVGMDTVFLNNQFGCDSLVITTTSLLPSDETQLTANTCDPQQVGMDTVFLNNQFGCDSLVITTTSLLPSDETQLTAGTCDPMQVGMDTVFLNNQFGCDSLVITTTSLLPSDLVFLDAASCDPNEVGLDTVFLNNQFGCDSLVVTNTTLEFPVTTPISETLCFGETIVINGTLYSASNPSGMDTLVAANGCDSILDITVNFLAPPATDAVSAQLCPGETFEFNGVTYDINNPGGTAVLLSQQTGCDSVIIDISLEFLELEAVVSSLAPLCAGDENGLIIIDTITGAAGPYTITLDGASTFPASGQGDTLFNLGAGIYELFIENQEGCQTTQSVAIESIPELTLELGNDQIVDLGEQVSIVPVTNFTPAQFIWESNGAIVCDTCPTLVITPDEDIDISLTLIDAFGCEISDALSIQVNVSRELYIPNGFSPNNDGINDFFTVFANGQLVQQVNTLRIFDRWGNLLFERNNFQPNDESLGWDGTYRGKAMNPGVYVYFAEVLFIDGAVRLEKGDVMVVR